MNFEKATLLKYMNWGYATCIGSYCWFELISVINVDFPSSSCQTPTSSVIAPKNVAAAAGVVVVDDDGGGGNEDGDDDDDVVASVCICRILGTHSLAAVVVVFAIDILWVATNWVPAAAVAPADVVVL